MQDQMLVREVFVPRCALAKAFIDVRVFHPHAHSNSKNLLHGCLARYPIFSLKNRQSDFEREYRVARQTNCTDVPISITRKTTFDKCSRFDNFEIISINGTTSNISGTTLEINCNRPMERTRHYRHQTRLLNFIAEVCLARYTMVQRCRSLALDNAEVNAANLTITQHRRA